MNQRIQELAQHAGMVKYPTSLGASENTIWGDKNIEKFAELIVRECAKEAFEFWCKQTDCNEESAQSHILRHFGVEE
jgi:hypothetical protein